MNVQEDLLQQEIDPYLTDENISAFATESLGIKAQCNGYSVLTGGCWNRVIAVSTDDETKHLVLKVTPKKQDADLKREFEVLRYFRNCTSMPVPEPFLLDLTGDRIPGSVLVMEKLSGTVLSHANQQLSNEERKTISEEVADHIINLHSCRVIGFGGVEVPAEQRLATWADFWIPRFDAVIIETQEKVGMDDNLLSEIGEVRRHLPQLLDIGAYGTLTHYDIWTGNVMVDFKADRPFVSGFLDISGFYADYARELSSMFSLADQEFMQVYEQRHGFDSSFRARFNIYTLKMCLQMACMYPSDPGGHIESVRRYLHDVQVYLDSQ
jgi:fructosamine-3-kinase